MGLTDTLRRVFPAAYRQEERNTSSAISVYDWAKMWRPGTQVSYDGRQYQGFQMASGGGVGAAYYDTNSVVVGSTANPMVGF
jgi:hypothetical protein